MNAAISAIFFMLWVLSFVDADGDGITTVAEANIIYTTINDYCGLTILITFLFFGFFSDKMNPLTFIPIGFAIHGVTLVSINFLASPNEVMSYVLWISYSASSLMCSIGVDGFYGKNIPDDIAGVMWSLVGCCSLIGLIISVLMGTIMYDISPGYPFLFIGSLDLGVVIFLLIMAKYGKFRRLDLQVQ